MAKLIASKVKSVDPDDTLGSRIILAFASLFVMLILYGMLAFLSYRFLNLHIFVPALFVAFVGGLIGGKRFYSLLLELLSKVGAVWNWSSWRSRGR